MKKLIAIAFLIAATACEKEQSDIKKTETRTITFEVEEITKDGKSHLSKPVTVTFKQ